MKKLAYLFIVSALLSCETKTDKSEEFTSRLAQEGSEDDVIETPIKTTTLSFNKMEHDFGNVVVGEDYTFKFIVKNTGNVPLVIEDAKASCGCTVPDKPEKPIKPGMSDEIVVTFSPKPGQGQTSKTITVTSNTNPKITTLTIRANVLEGMGSEKTKPDATKGTDQQTTFIAPAPTK